MHPATRRAIFRRLQAANPAPTTELLHTSPFELLVAVMLSAHTTDKSVNAATRVLFPVANTPEAIAALGVEGVKPYIKTVGLYNTKAKNLDRPVRSRSSSGTAGEVPAEREALEALPGRRAQDGEHHSQHGVRPGGDRGRHAHLPRRQPHRARARARRRSRSRTGLDRQHAGRVRRNAHHWLLLHGRYVCTARAPACPNCIIRDLCEYPAKTPARVDAHDAPHAPRTAPAAARARGLNGAP